MLENACKWMNEMCAFFYSLFESILFHVQLRYTRNGSVYILKIKTKRKTFIMRTHAHRSPQKYSFAKISLHRQWNEVAPNDKYVEEAQRKCEEKYEEEEIGLSNGWKQNQCRLTIFML